MSTPIPARTGTPQPARSAPAERPALEGMSEARRPTGPVLALVVAVLIMFMMPIPAALFIPELPENSLGGQLTTTLTFLLPMLGFFLWVRFKEKRPIASLGFRGPAVRHIALAALLAAGMTSVTVLLNVALGTATLGSPHWGAIGPVLLVLIGFAVQSSAEEVFVRGYVMQALATRWGLVVAMIVQTVVFTLLHGANGGLTWVAWGNLAGLALFTGLWVWVTGSLWGACAFHTFWNWSQGNLWGTSVSNVQMSASVGDFVPNSDSPSVLTGGTFGLEGSVFLLVLVTLGSIVLLVVGRRRRAPTGRVQAD